MADGKQQPANQKSGIVVINSRDVNQRVSAGELPLSQRKQPEYSKVQSSEPKSMVEMTDLEESFDKSRRTPADLLNGIMLDIYKYSHTSQPGSKFNLENSNRKRGSKSACPTSFVFLLCTMV